MRRREFIAGLAATVISPGTGHAQEPLTPVIGLLHTGAPGAAGGAMVVAAVRRGLAEMGYVESRNLKIEYRWAQDHLERLPELAADLVGLQVAAIVVATTPAALVVKGATKSTAVIFSIGTDPVQLGLVGSLNRPGGNLTGIYNLNNDVAAKRLEVLREIVPAATSIAYLVNPTNPAFGEIEAREMRAAADISSVSLLVLNVTASSELEPAFARVVGERAGAIVVGGDGLFFLTCAMELSPWRLTIAYRPCSRGATL